MTAADWAGAQPVGAPGAALAALSLSGPADRFAGGRTAGLVEEMQRIALAFTDA